ncbi:nuclear factor of activated T-cells, cytoplasmic 4 isoform X2 [Gadus macrocephalus]|uniref:nuclear factor of activated T-cells, cytoplasmic 4 isoform X2 n=1 Tax=Gadus macrocephalus TaxID=80720 RepID=UPI0028CB873F|nr:nuclear factor of activated T-cells, cytoplasmic 4 isoform X2 [Gadus macrocephalus]
MGAAPGPGWEEGEFEFKLVFEEDPPRPLHQGPSPLLPAAADALTENPGERTEGDLAHLDCDRDSERHLNTSQGNQPVGISGLSPSANQRAGMHSPPPRRALLSESRVMECPSIQITTISQDDDPAPPGSRYWDTGGGGGSGWDRERLYLPLLDPFSYRDGTPGSLSPSPASSPSSRGWLSPASSCDSLLVEEDDLSESAVHLVLSPSSRPTSPGGKKRRNTPLGGSPCASRRGSYSSEEPHAAGPDGHDSAPLSQAPPLGCELSIPQKTRKTSLEQLSSREVDPEPAPGHSAPCPVPEEQQPRREPPSVGMDYLSVPPALGWGRTRASAHSPLFRTNALPPLDWPLPSQFDQYELRMEVQPRPHHRAHYETEGSRGAVKAAPAGHPVVKLCGYTDRKPLSLQVFVGTADDRSIRPHPFYQIHRVTGKMVGTASQESVQAGTKILDIPLSPESSMTALIDCAGILKLRNSDIELRKGETDVGRKNTRVRLVFRTHLPLAPSAGAPGRVLALQVASLPIECSQRSAQELPVIESVSLTSCCVEGGEELLLSGTNFLPISRVLFMERGTDGKLQWEEEARVDRENSNEGLLCVRVPAYSDRSVSRPVAVCLYVSNGKRKRSSTHCFKYIPIMFKEEESLRPRPLALAPPPAPPLDGLCPMESSMEKADGPPRGDPTSEDALLGFHLPPYPSAYSSPLYPVALGTHDEYFPRPDARPDDQGGGDGGGRGPCGGGGGGGGGGPLAERHAGFESLELGFTELLPPRYPHGGRGARPPSPSPWLDSPYLSSSPSPSHSSSLSPFPAGSPLSGSPLPPPGPHYPAYGQQEAPPSPPSSAYQDFYYPPPYSHYDGGCWDPPPGRGVAPVGGRWAEGSSPFPGSSPSTAAMHHITLEEVNEFIGEDIQSFGTECQMDNHPH